MTDPAPTVVPIGDNPTRLWGITAAERLRRIARDARLRTGAAGGAEPTGARLLVATSHVFDRQWLGFMQERPGAVLTIGDTPVLAHVPAGLAAPTLLDAAAVLPAIRAEDHRVFYNAALRKREEPFLEPLEPATIRRIERLSYFGAYKGVTDLLTKYLWPEWALMLTRLSARIGMTPNGVTAIGAALCVAATFLFWYGWYWTGMATGLGFMVLDTVDGKLARCTITASGIGEAFDHGIDLVHPPFWWWAWGVGLSSRGLALPDRVFTTVMIAIVGGYIVQRLIEGEFIRRFAGMHIHVWRKFDSDFRLVTARRNPNMVILFFAMALARPDLGLIAVAWWTVISCAVHAVRLMQAIALQARGGKIRSWLTEETA